MKKPTTSIDKVFGGLILSVGSILFLTTLHLMVLSETGNMHSVLLTTFTVALRILIALATIAFVFILIYFIKVLIYIAITPKWLREEEKNG